MTQAVGQKGVGQAAEGGLLQPVRSLHGVGPQVAVRLQRLNIHTLQDLLFHFPLRYEDRTRVTPIGALRPGMEAVIQAEVMMTEPTSGRRPALVSRVSDGTGSLTLRFFHFGERQRASLAPHAYVRCYAEVRRGLGTLEMVHPEYQRIDDLQAAPEGRLTPVYPATEGLRQGTLRNLIARLLSQVRAVPFGAQDAQGWPLEELLPGQVLERFHWPGVVEALAYIHAPPADAPVDMLTEVRHPAYQRLAFEELLAHHLGLRQVRRRIEHHRAPRLAASGRLLEELVRRLPFPLTSAQRRVIDEILADLSGAAPMHRLIQGDVGSGKTVVAAAVAAHVAEAGYQVAVMAPTELLAEQHYHNFHHWLMPLGVKVAWLAGRLKGTARRAVLDELQSGGCAVAVGTHALFQEGVTFDRLALVVVDEQHRFGVDQRLTLLEKGRRGGLYPHQLVMSATPIPRTLAMTAYADLDNSVIDELPAGRRPVTTVVIPEQRRDEVIERIRLACGQGRQAYWVCPLIEESQSLDCQSAIDTARQLAGLLAELHIGLVHGRMKAQEKERVMQAFKAGQVDLLVATTVIEVGVDVPNATLMIIENAERLGLTQLHQLRGRVGRGGGESSCVLLYRAPLSRLGKARMAILRQTHDGFEVARRDLELRGPGEVLGTRQTGALQFRVADLARDRDLVPRIQEVSKRLHDEYPERIPPLIRRWVGSMTQYGSV